MGLYDYKLVGAVLVVLVVLAAVGGGCGYVGYTIRDNAAKAEAIAARDQQLAQRTAMLKERDAAIAQEREAAAADMQAAVKAERQRMQARADAATRDQQLAQELASHAPPADCVVSDVAFRLLCQSAAAAGAAASPNCADSLHGQMPAAPGAGLKINGRPGASPGFRVSDLRGMFSPTD